MENYGFRRTGLCGAYNMGVIKKGLNTPFNESKCGEGNLIRSQADCEAALGTLGYDDDSLFSVIDQTNYQPGCSRIETSFGNLNVFNNINSEPTLYHEAPSIHALSSYPICWDNVPE